MRGVRGVRGERGGNILFVEVLWGEVDRVALVGEERGERREDRRVGGVSRADAVARLRGGGGEHLCVPR